MVNNFYVTTEALMKSSGDSLILNAKKKPLFTIAKRLLLSGGGTVKPPIRFNTKPLPGTKTFATKNLCIQPLPDTLFSCNSEMDILVF
jgi:hypothetical protein